MTSAESITAMALKPLAGGRIYPDVAPPCVVCPYIVYQSVGGMDETTFDGPGSLQNARMQVSIWSTTRGEAVALMQKVLLALIASPVNGKPAGAPVSIYEDDTKLYGSRLDISIWFTV